ncbi:site-specific integrase [Actinomycetospora aurantiaca]|uniref:site-specific integrase n=1 Tax=Actinomycetospora aurantiaca TaxID=3129233 RepID=UPI00359F3ED8
MSGWLSGFRSPRTRRAYAGDLLLWQRWCTAREVDPLRARRVQVDLYLAHLLDGGAAPTSAGRRLSALSSFYGFLLDQDDLDIARTNPAAAVRRPAVDAQHPPHPRVDPRRSRRPTRRRRPQPRTPTAPERSNAASAPAQRAPRR